MPRVCPKQVLRKLRQLARAERRLVTHHQGSSMLHIPVLARLHVQHERRQRPLHPRQLPAQHHEARAAHSRRSLEVHHAQLLADVGVILRRVVELPRLAMPAHLLVPRLVRPLGHALMRNVGQAREQIVPRLRRLRLFGARALDRLLRRRHLGHQARRQRLVLRRLRLADLLRLGVARLLGRPLLEDRRTHHLVQLQDRRHFRRPVHRRPARQRGCVGFGILSDGADIVHGRPSLDARV